VPGRCTAGLRCAFYRSRVRPPLSFDDVESLEGARTPAEHRTAADVLAGWAGEQHPDDDDVTPAALLSAAAWHLDMAGDPVAALELHRRAAAVAGDVPPDVRCYLHGALLKAGRADEARALADEVRRSAPDDLDVHVLMAENYEAAGDLRQANRWLALGTTRLDAADLEGRVDDDRALALLTARRRVRAALDLPPDGLDLLVPPPDPAG
jgi:predicted Zn-dependent protease